MAENEQPDLLKPSVEDTPIETVPGTTEPTEQEPTSAEEEQKKEAFFDNNRHKAMVAIAGIALLAVFGAAAMSNKGGASNIPQQTTNTAVDPSNPDNLPGHGKNADVVTPPPVTSPEVTAPSYDQAMERFKSMDITESEHLSIDERLQYPQFLIDKMAANGAYAKGYAYETSAGNYSINPVAVSKDNSGQDILNNNMYNRQMSWLQYVPDVKAKEKLFNLADGEKVLSAVYLEVADEKVASTDYAKEKQLLESFTNPTYTPYKETAKNTGKMTEGLDREGNKYEYKVVTYTRSDDSKTWYTRFVYHTYKNYKGEESAIWLIDASTTDKAAVADMGIVR